jgi:hypothetical protein
LDILLEFSFAKYFFRPKINEELKDSATIVVDTNVLLAAYQWKEVTLREVLDTLYNLASKNRLKIPSHVFNEFMDQRPKRLVEIVQKIDNELNTKLQRPTKLVSIVPFLDLMRESNDYIELEKRYIEIHEMYRKEFSKLKGNVTDFFQHDPVLEQMKRLLKECFFSLDGSETKDIETEATERYRRKIPPLTGGDSGKKENAYGDYIIWKHILKLKQDVIFVTTDTKEDWFIKDHLGKQISPRRELIEEFYEISEGKTFTILSPIEFVALFKPDVDDIVANDLSETDGDSETKSSFRKMFILRKIFNNYDLADIYKNELIDYDYNKEIEAILELLPHTKTIGQLADDIYNVFMVNFSGHITQNMALYYQLANELIGLLSVINRNNGMISDEMFQKFRSKYER